MGQWDEKVHARGSFKTHFIAFKVSFDKKIFLSQVQSDVKFRKENHWEVLKFKSQKDNAIKKLTAATHSNTAITEKKNSPTPPPPPKSPPPLPMRRKIHLYQQRIQSTFK